jgi:hypothetical protein
MSILDFKEIPQANLANGAQDTFELFAREFLTYMGYKIIIDPNRGADGGGDLIVEEKRTGVGGETLIRWLVSCKHKAHSGTSVSHQDDSNILDRVAANGCNGFIGFYSTLSSTGLSGSLKGLAKHIECQIFDREKIEGLLTKSSEGLKLVERFFPQSLSKLKTENPQPAQIFSDAAKLQCKVCNKDLLDPANNGIITFWQRMSNGYKNEPEHIEYIFWVCKGHCDKQLSSEIQSKQKNLVDGWEDISDVMIPTVFIKWIMSIFNQLRGGTIYSDEAFKQLKEFILNVYSFISRELSSKEKERVKFLIQIPLY